MMIFNIRRLAIVATAALLVACSTSTPYQPASEPGAFDGYTATMIENDRARISFAGNSLTDRETVQNYLLYRSAEVAKEKGYDYFTLIERDTEEMKRLRVSPGYSYGRYDPYFSYGFYRPRYGWSRGYRYGHFNGFRGSRFGHGGFGHRGFGGFHNDRFFNDYDVREITKYRASAEVKFGRGAKPVDQDNAFNAEEVLTNLGPSITYPEEES